MQLYLLILAVGLFRARQEKAYFPGLPKQTYCIVLDDYAREREKSYQVIGRIINSKAKIIAYLPKAGQVGSAGPGSLLVFEGRPDVVTNDGNPFEFDYRRYLNDRGIGYRIFLKEGQYVFPDVACQPDLFHKALIIRKKLVDNLARSGLGQDHLPLAASIAFGAREAVDEDTVRAFTNTGVIHVLAVSGMNVGLLYIILNLFLQFLKSGRAGIVLHTVAMILAIWGYALVSGMSASILRAAVMFTFVIVGTNFRRKATMYNSLAVSAFVLIFIQPAILRDIGFQLSYAALVSIVVLQPFVYNLLIFKNKLADKAWMLFSVTLAAQAGTLPFTLLYFHQFPSYFWLANMLVIPLVTLILYLTVFLTFLPLISEFLGTLIAHLLDWLAEAVVFIVSQIEKFPHSVLGGLYPETPEILLFTFMVVFLFLSVKYRKVQYLYSFLLAALLMSFHSGALIYRQLARKEALFFNVPGARVLALTSGRKSVVLCDRRDHGVEKLRRYLDPYLGARGIESIDFHCLEDSAWSKSSIPGMAGTLIRFKDITIFVHQGNERDSLPSLPREVDVAWFAGGQVAGRTLAIHNRGAKTVPSPEGQEQPGRAEGNVQYHKMDRAMVLTFRKSREAGGPAYSCDYF